MRIITYIKESPNKGLLHKKHGHLQVEAFQILIMQETKEKFFLLIMATALILETIWLLGRVRNKVLCLVPLLK